MKNCNTKLHNYSSKYIVVISLCLTDLHYNTLDLYETLNEFFMREEHRSKSSNKSNMWILQFNLFHISLITSFLTIFQ